MNIEIYIIKILRVIRKHNKDVSLLEEFHRTTPVYCISEKETDRKRHV